MCVCVCASCGSVRACVNEERTVILVFLSGKSCSFFWQMGVGARTGADGQHGPAGGTSSGSSQFPQPPRRSQGQSATARSTDGLRSPCDRQPHCANWRRHENHSKLGLEKKLQYLFLYAAEARSLTCMRHYVEVAHVVLGSCLLFLRVFCLRICLWQLSRGLRGCSPMSRGRGCDPRLVRGSSGCTQFQLKVANFKCKSSTRSTFPHLQLQNHKSSTRSTFLQLQLQNLRRATCAEQLAQSSLRRATCRATSAA